MLIPAVLTLVGSGRHRRVHLAQKAAALGAPQDFARQERAVALHRDIQIVLQRQRDHVLHRKIEIAAAHQRFQPRRIDQLGGGTTRFSRWKGARSRPTTGGGFGDWMETSLADGVRRETSEDCAQRAGTGTVASTAHTAPQRIFVLRIAS